MNETKGTAGQGEGAERAPLTCREQFAMAAIQGYAAECGIKVDVSLPATDERRERVPMKRYGRAKEVSSLIAWLASEDGGYMTGQNLRIDGGLTRAV